MDEVDDTDDDAVIVFNWIYYEPSFGIFTESRLYDRRPVYVVYVALVVFCVGIRVPVGEMICKWIKSTY